MKHVQALWDEDDTARGNVQHIAEHGLTIDDVEHVLEHPTSETASRASGRPCVFGYTPSGDYFLVVYEEISKDTLYPITAYEVPEPQKEPST